MLETPVVFQTNIDCCKWYMGNISGMPLSRINPMVGDLVRVYKDSALEIYLKVISRRWTMINGSTPTLTCELHLQDGWNIPMLEKVLRS